MCKVDNFIGSRFGVDGHLEVIGWHGERHGTAKLYSVKCSVCEKDAELHEDATYIVKKANLIKGSIPCGCAISPKWSQSQYIVKVKRECAERGYTLLGFAGKYSGNRTKLNLLCNIDGHEWCTTDIASFFSGRGCGKCKLRNNSEINTKPDAEIIQSFFSTGAFKDGTNFWRSSRLTKIGTIGYWNYTCPTCSNDEYVKAGLCDGVFESSIGNLQGGGISCRCSKAVRWTQSQREYQIRKIIATESLQYEFLGWCDEYVNSSSKFILDCAEHGVWEPSCGSFISQGQRCPSCSRTGYDPHKPGFVYALLVDGRSTTFTGYGISNVVKNRLKTHRQNLKKFGLQIIETQVFSTSGTTAALIERDLKRMFEVYPQDVEGFKTEATLAVYYDRVTDFIKEACHG